MYMMARIEAGAGELKVQSQVCLKLSDRQNSIFLTETTVDEMLKD
jgi:hypothetical protein